MLCSSFSYLLPQSGIPDGGKINEWIPGHGIEASKIPGPWLFLHDKGFKGEMKQKAMSEVCSSSFPWVFNFASESPFEGSSMLSKDHRMSDNFRVFFSPSFLRCSRVQVRSRSFPFHHFHFNSGHNYNLSSPVGSCNHIEGLIAREKSDDSGENFVAHRIDLSYMTGNTEC